MKVLTSLAQVLADEVYTLAELAPLVRVSPVTLTREIRAGKLVAAKIRGQWRVQGKDFLAYLENSKTEDKQPRPKKEDKSSPSDQGQPFTKLNPDRLLAAWRQQDADLDRPDGRSAPSSG